MNKKSKHEEHEEHADETWLIPYADLLTLLLALFIVLYAMSSVDAKKFEDMSKAFSVAFNEGNGVLEQTGVITNANQMDDNDKDKNNSQSTTQEQQQQEQQQMQQQRQQLMQKEQEDLEKLKKQMDQYIKKNGLTTQLETKLNQAQLMITISDNALFASGESKLKPESRQLAVSISNMLQQYPEYEIIVSGHTDNQPISTPQFESNWDLSSSRAIRFMDVLLSNPKLDPKRFSAIGYGEFRPLASNSTEAGRSKNRRVEVSVIRKYVDSDNTQQVPVTPKP